MKKTLSTEQKAAAQIARLRRSGQFQQIGLALLDEQIGILERVCAALRRAGEPGKLGLATGHGK